MGANLARNAARKGFGVALYNRHGSRTDELMREAGKEGRFFPAKALPDFVAAIRKPRAIIVMVKAGKPVDDVIDELVPHLEPGDILIDGGNSQFTDTNRRFADLKDTGIRFIGMGVSGGEEGALNGPSMMPGGEPDSYRRIEPIVRKMAAQVEGTPCVAFIGPAGAGHYVKMVHNGIEYADMQLIAEAYDLLKSVYGLEAEAIAGIFEEWQGGDLDSYLIEITAAVLRKRDATGGALVDAIVDEAEQKGTGRWAVQSALDLGVPLTSITEAVFARALSAQKEARVRAARILKGPSPGHVRVDRDMGLVEDVRDALYASKIVAYAQGFEHLAAGSREYGWSLDLGSLATIWRGGCIIRAQFLDRICDAYAEHPDLQNLMLAPFFQEALASAQDAWRRVIKEAVDRGIPVPA